MKIHWKNKDGGPESLVHMWGIESKRFGSIVLLRFGRGSREAYHTHAFDAVSWLLSGCLHEENRDHLNKVYLPSLAPIRTPKARFHKVTGISGASWALSFRGGWVDRWLEFNERGLETLTHGRKVV